MADTSPISTNKISCQNTAIELAKSNNEPVAYIESTGKNSPLSNFRLSSPHSTENNGLNTTHFTIYQLYNMEMF